MMNKEIKYQVQYQKIGGEEAWIDVGPSMSEHSDALHRIDYENRNDPRYNHRIIVMSWSVHDE